MTHDQQTTHRRPVNSICGDCARANGGVWPQGHLATFSIDDCDACKGQSFTCSVDDWHWPKGKPKGWCGTGKD